MLIPVFDATIYSTTPTYRYFRLNIDACVDSTAAGLYEMELSDDGGSTWYPSSNMTSNSAPSPLVASADAEYSATYAAWKAFDGDGTTTRWASTASAFPHYLTIDLGSGNEIAPNRLRITSGNFGAGSDQSLVTAQLLASNTGSFGGEEVTLYSLTGGGSKADQTQTTYSF